MSLREDKHVQKWFIQPNGERSFTERTEDTYLYRIHLICGLLHKNLEELANADSNEVTMIHRELADKLRDELHRKTLSVDFLISTLNSYLEANGVPLTDEQKKRRDIPKHPELYRESAKARRKRHRTSIQ